MLLVAAGMASSGYIPFASTFAILQNAFEQMRNGIARPNLAVHLCGPMVEHIQVRMDLCSQ